MKKRIAIIGASYLQMPLILKAESMGYETHVFAWKAGDPGESAADYFYPYSIVEKDRILDECRRIGIDGIATIASDLAVITVNYVAEKMGLTGNTMQCTMKSTNKHLMRECFRENEDPSVYSILVKNADELKEMKLNYPLIVKPTDRSGSRAITKITEYGQLNDAIAQAVDASFEKAALVEEFAEGDEYSVECISYGGIHHFLAVTKKYTTGAPHFIETGHMEPAPLDKEITDKIKKIIFHALDSLEIRYGASHSEIKIDREGSVRIIEIGGRMGGDMIGSDLVFLSTGIDYVKTVVQATLGEQPDLSKKSGGKPAGIRFILNEHDLEILRDLEENHPEYLIRKEVHDLNPVVTDSGTRSGYFLFSADDAEEIDRWIRK